MLDNWNIEERLKEIIRDYEILTESLDKYGDHIDKNFYTVTSTLINVEIHKIRKIFSDKKFPGNRPMQKIQNIDILKEIEEEIIDNLLKISYDDLIMQSILDGKDWVDEFSENDDEEYIETEEDRLMMERLRNL